jgi:hypothetical protein
VPSSDPWIEHSLATPWRSAEPNSRDQANGQDLLDHRCDLRQAEQSTPARLLLGPVEQFGQHAAALISGSVLAASNLRLRELAQVARA